MKRFIFKTFLLSTPLLILCLEPFLPLSFFTYRPWEALLYEHAGITMPFYPNQELKMVSVGDLCHHTKYAISKDEKWITDKLGYRNDKYIEDPDILLIGDSFIVGSGLTQDSALTNTLIREFNYGVSVYNINANFSEFITLLEENVIKKPKTIIYSIVERNIPEPIHYSQQKTAIYKDGGRFSIFVNRMTRFYALKFLKARIFKEHGVGIQGINNSQMFFLNGTNQKNNNNIVNITENIISYKEFCDSAGIQFIFMALPNKETVYFEKVPLKCQPDYLFKLDSILKSNNVISINILELFNNFRKNNTRLIYHLDDTHWNSNGVKLVAEKIAEVICSNKKQD